MSLSIFHIDKKSLYFLIKEIHMAKTKKQTKKVQLTFPAYLDFNINLTI